VVPLHQTDEFKSALAKAVEPMMSAISSQQQIVQQIVQQIAQQQIAQQQITQQQTAQRAAPPALTLLEQLTMYKEVSTLIQGVVPAAPVAAPAPTLLEQLTMYKEVSTLIQGLVPAAPVAPPVALPVAPTVPTFKEMMDFSIEHTAKSYEFLSKVLQTKDENETKRVEAFSSSSNRMVEQQKTANEKAKEERATSVDVAHKHSLELLKQARGDA
jgi:hypothetical protein